MDDRTLKCLTDDAARYEAALRKIVGLDDYPGLSPGALAQEAVSLAAHALANGSRNPNAAAKPKRR